MAEINSIAPSATRWINFDSLIQEVESCRYCVALTGADGKAIAGSQLTDDFESLSDAFVAHAGLLLLHPSAAVFDVRGIDVGAA